MDYIDIEQAKALMPEMVKADFEQPLARFVEDLRGDLKNPYLSNDLKTPLASSANYRSYLEVLGSNNSYTKLGWTIQGKPAVPPESEAREMVTRVRRMTRDMYVNDRLREFESVRQVIYDGLQKMHESPMYITDKRFGYLVSLIEQTRSASQEMHLHFGNAFVKAWDRIPSMQLELSIRPGESIKVSRDEADAEIRRHRSRSQGMSM